ncbi:sporulation protein YunB [Hathewaya massiliensis]|uniref:sporulation protein YunB n=1 Tax=Hathewaya massiliensis TaxID=1964382 RepID=UPI0011598315|nr:sporulation protein YunB [Hathewaya massiliensis]
MKLRKKDKFILYIICIIVFFILFIYTFDKTVSPTVLAVSEAEIKLKAIESINNCILEEMESGFKYDDIIKIEKDDQGNIVMMRADTLKLNRMATDISLKSQKKLNEIGVVGIKIPLGYITKNNILSYLGPDITVKMEPLSHVETTYSSLFQSAGINQTSHKIFVKFKTKVRIIIPLNSIDTEIYSEMPISETIIVGKIPDSSIQLDLSGSGYKK